MTHNEGFERLVSDWLHERADWTAPTYLDEVLVRTRRTRQRPSWSGLVARLPRGWATLRISELPLARLVVIIALVLALAAAALLVGSRPKLPPPFGLAGNGLILYGAGDGDLYALDLASGVSTPIVAGRPEDETPEFAHDGSRFVFARKAEAPGRWLLIVANADGSNPRPLTGPVDPRWNAWSADDMQVAVVDAATVPPTLTLYRLDGRAPLSLDIDGHLAANAAFLPDGSEIVFLGSKSGSSGIYAVATTGASAARTIVPPIAGSAGITHPILSPDGTTLAYTRWDGDHSAIHLVDVATGDDRQIKLDATSDGENTAAWSPDGTRLLFHRHRSGSYQLAVAPVSGGAVLIGPLFPDGTGGADVVFSPDGRMVVARYEHDGSHWLLDVAGGPGSRLAIGASAAITWQRVAP